MNTNTQLGKIDKVLSKISGKEMKNFVRLYAATHEDFATALVEKYWKPERGNYKEMVEITCREFEHDHQGFKPLRYDLWAEENKVLKEIVTKSADMVMDLRLRIILINITSRATWEVCYDENQTF